MPTPRRRKWAELFDKYDLLTRSSGKRCLKTQRVITSDDVISLLRAKLWSVVGESAASCRPLHEVSAIFACS